MPLEITDVLASLGIDKKPEEITADEFKSVVGEKYVLKESVLKDESIKKQITGKVLGTISTNLAKELGLTSGEIKDKTVEEIVGAYKQKVAGQITKLEEEGKKGNDKKIEDLLKKQGEFEAAIKLKDDGLKEWENKYNTDIASERNSVKKFKLDSLVGKLKTDLAPKFSDEYTKDELKRAGFDAHMNNTYDFDVDENDKLVIKLKDGSLVKSKKVIGNTATAEEVFEMEMEAKGVLKKNNATNTKVITTFAQPNNEGGGTGKSKIHPNALKNQARLSEQKK